MALAEKRKVSIATREQLLARFGAPPGVVVQRRTTGYNDVIDVYMPSAISVPPSRRVPVFDGFEVDYHIRKAPRAGRW